MKGDRPGRPDSCVEPGCRGRIAPDGYCDTCGSKPAAKPSPGAGPTPVAGAGPTPVAGPADTGSGGWRGARRSGSTTRTAVRRAGSIGAGLFDLAPAPAVDPATVVLHDPRVAEDKRFCSKCDGPVGRARPDAPGGRTAGVCSQCRHRFDFEPKLRRGEIVGGQYEVAGCLAHGGLGWIYLARDKAVNDRWVVLKGLLDAGDEASMRVAVAERQFLAELSHPGIVGIFNFVTDRGAGYIVMEYVGGRSLKQLLAERRAANSGQPDPLPVAEALAFVLAILPAFAYLHGRALLYCDFKPDNLIQVGDQVKLIDMGAVRRLNDLSGDVYGTAGFQAPEIAERGPSIPSDVYTIGRTLAVLTLDFKGYQRQFAHALPDPADHPALARHDSFRRLVSKATAADPDDRFQTVGEMGEQMLGVLREVVALQTGRPQAAPSSVFAPAPDDGSLPSLTVDPADAASGFLSSLSADSPDRALDAIQRAVAGGTVVESVEVRLRRARALLDRGDGDDRSRAMAQLDLVEVGNPWEWRAAWLRGVDALAQGLAQGPADGPVDVAARCFDRCRSELPGEVAPKLAAAVVLERAGRVVEAAALYGVVVAIDPNYVAAARGLARCRAASGDVAGALSAFDQIPTTHRAHARARVDAVRMLIGAGEFQQAADRLSGTAELERSERLEVEAELFEAALRSLMAKGAPPGQARGLGGRPFTERGLRSGLEAALRRRARLSSDPGERIALVDRANRERPRTLL